MLSGCVSGRVSGWCILNSQVLIGAILHIFRKKSISSALVLEITETPTLFIHEFHIIEHVANSSSISNAKNTSNYSSDIIFYEICQSYAVVATNLCHTNKYTATNL